MDWLYVWSPRYRFFHEFLFATIHDLSGFCVKPVFAEQHLFTPRKATSLHFLAGIPIKIYVIRNYIQQNLGKIFLFSDVDLIVLPTFQIQDLESYKENDITCMKEIHAPIPYNIGCMLIRCTSETFAFFDRILQRITEDNLLDQDAFHQEMSSFSGRIGFFSETEYLQSNMLSDDIDSYKIIQCLCSEQDPIRILVEKVLTICSFYDITPLQQYLPDEVNALLFA